MMWTTGSHDRQSVTSLTETEIRGCDLCAMKIEIREGCALKRVTFFGLGMECDTYDGGMELWNIEQNDLPNFDPRTL